MRVLLRHLHKDWARIITLTICVSCPLQSHDPWCWCFAENEDTSQSWHHGTAGHCRDVVIIIFTFMLRCWMFRPLWVGLSPASLYSHISTQHWGNTTAPTAPQQHATADPLHRTKQTPQTSSKMSFKQTREYPHPTCTSYSLLRWKYFVIWND